MLQQSLDKYIANNWMCKVSAYSFVGDVFLSGFGAAGGGHPYMMGFQGGMPMQMQPNPQQYLQNHRPQGDNGSTFESIVIVGVY